jgi:aldose 1-epimerase
VIQLTAGKAQAQVLPAIGAGLAGLWLDGRPVLRPWSGIDADGPFALGMNLLAPFSNRISGGFRHDNIDYTLPPNLSGEAYPIHGDAFQRTWAVTERTPDSAILQLPDGSFGPYRYRAEVRYRLSESEFRVGLELINLGALALPFGAGFHPWFPRSAQTQIRFGADGYWPENMQHLPATSTALLLPPELDFTESRGLPQCWINAGFAGWTGQALIKQGPEAVSVRLSSDDLRTAILYSPSVDADFFCFEPVSHPVDAHNLPDRPGLVTLAAGENLSVGMTLVWS